MAQFGPMTQPDTVIFEHLLVQGKKKPLEKFIVKWTNFNNFFVRRPAQFSSLAVDVSGDLVASGATDVYEVFLWSVATGHLLEVK